MSTCSDGHDEVCYTSRQCPVCVELTNLLVANKELKQERKNILFAEDQILKLEAKLESYEADYRKWKEVVDKLEERNYGTSNE